MNAVLDGLGVLIVEDEMIAALDLVEQVEAMGGHVVGPAPRVADAMELLKSCRPDLALLDLELRDGWITPVAEALVIAGVPFALLTGYPGNEFASSVLNSAPRLRKPYSERQLLQLLQAMAIPHRIQQVAYAIWEQEGRPEDQAVRHWAFAERLVRRQAAARGRSLQHDVGMCAGGADSGYG
jgi:two-component SAPR family response regulator